MYAHSIKVLFLTGHLREVGVLELQAGDLGEDTDVRALRRTSTKVND